MLNETTIKDALRNVQDPELHRDIVTRKIKNIRYIQQNY